MTDLNYLLLVVEEAAEVIHRAMKLARFGAADIDPAGQHKGKTALQALAEEIILASEDNGDSFAARKRNESEKQADSAR